MLAYIKGTLEMKMTGYIVIDVGGLGYKVFMSESGIDKLGNIGETVKVHTYYKVREDCLKVMHENPEQNINQGVKLLFVARYLERIGDHITNVCEKIIYAKKGTMVEIG